MKKQTMGQIIRLLRAGAILEKGFYGWTIRDGAGQMIQVNDRVMKQLDAEAAVEAAGADKLKIHPWYY